jgi:hypothetical protein
MSPSVSLKHSARTWVLVGIVHVYLACAAMSAPGDGLFETRYQYYQEGQGRMRVDSDYSLFSVDLSDTLVLDGTLLYSTLSGASPTGLPPLTKGGQVPTVFLKDQRYAASLGLTQQIGDHSIKGGLSYSYEGDYLSLGASLQDTISLNEKNTELVLGVAYTNDTVGANGSNFEATKRSYDTMVGINQILDPNTLLSFNVGLGWKQGYLSDPYKRVLIDNQVSYDTRPDHKFEQLALIQLTHYISSWDASVEASYRLGHNDFGSTSHTAQLALYKYLLNKRVVIRPSIRFYDQSAARFYNTQFSGNPAYASADYRLSAEQSLNLGLQIRWNIIKDKLALDVGYERYRTWGTDHKTSQSAYPDANSITVGFHYQF